MQHESCIYTMKNKTHNYGGYNDSQNEELEKIYSEYLAVYTEDRTGDACKGDEVIFAKAIFAGSYRKPKFSHFEMIEGLIIADSYGSEKQQHTFTILKISGEQMRIKGRNIYRYLLLAKPRSDSERSEILDEKHSRGSVARKARATRKEKAYG